MFSTIKSLLFIITMVSAVVAIVFILFSSSNDDGSVFSAGAKNTPMGGVADLKNKLIGTVALVFIASILISGSMESRDLMRQKSALMKEEISKNLPADQ